MKTQQVSNDGLIFVFKFNFPSSKQPLKMSYFQNTATIPDPFFVVIPVISDQPFPLLLFS